MCRGNFPALQLAHMRAISLVYMYSVLAMMIICDIQQSRIVLPILQHVMHFFFFASHLHAMGRLTDGLEDLRSTQIT